MLTEHGDHQGPLIPADPGRPEAARAAGKLQANTFQPGRVTADREDRSHGPLVGYGEVGAGRRDEFLFGLAKQGGQVRQARSG